jgi:hypothetical protein
MSACGERKGMLQKVSDARAGASALSLRAQVATALLLDLVAATLALAPRDRITFLSSGRPYVVVLAPEVERAVQRLRSAGRASERVYLLFQNTVGFEHRLAKFRLAHGRE